MKIHYLTLTIAACSLLNICAGQPSSCSNSLDLLKNAEWKGYVDAYGSTLERLVGSSDEIVYQYKIQEAPAPAQYAWVDMSCNLPDLSALAGFKSLMIRYKSSHKLVVSLTQPTLTEFGECYQKVIPATAAWQTAFLPYNEFKQPDWAKNTQIAFNINEVYAVSLVPDTDEKNTSLGQVSVSELRLCEPSLRLKPSLNR